MGPQALTYGTYDDFCRPYVDCGLYTGCFCDGLLARGFCLAADRVPSAIAWSCATSVGGCLGSPQPQLKDIVMLWLSRRILPCRMLLQWHS